MTEQHILQTITIEFPVKETQFAHELFRILHPVASIRANGLLFNKSDPALLPNLQFAVAEIAECRVIFALDNTRTIKTDLVNMTGVKKDSPHDYGYYTIQELETKLKDLPICILDHIGFNLPWFAGGTHPLVAFLQSNLKNKALYHLYPTGEPWDFIIPGTKEEISNMSVIDYTKNRKPKFELVSFEKSSTPLIQIDISVDGSHSEIKKRFPKALHVDELSQSWVYITNPLGIDICFVLNEQKNSDWSDFFALSRLQ
jgi:hypothetical protein